MTSNMVLQALNPIMANHEPELQGAEAAAEGNLPVAVIKHRSRGGGLVLQIFRKDAERLDEGGAIGHPEAVAVEIGEHPFVRIEGIAVRQFHAILQVAKLRAQ